MGKKSDEKLKKCVSGGVNWRRQKGKAKSETAFTKVQGGDKGMEVRNCARGGTWLTGGELTTQHIKGHGRCQRGCPCGWMKRKQKAVLRVRVKRELQSKRKAQKKKKINRGKEIRKQKIKIDCTRG